MKPVSSPSTARLWFERGVAAEREGDLDAALDAYRVSIKSSGREAAPWVGMASVLEANQQYEDARECLKRGVRVDPRHLAARMKLARAEQRLGGVDAAQMHFEIAVTLAPRNPRTHVGLGSLLEDTGDAHGAASAYRRALEVEPENAEALAGVLGLFGSVDAGGEIDQARALLSTTSNRDRALIGYALGKALDAKGEFEQAFEAFRQANLARQTEAGKFDREAFDKRVERIVRLFSPAFFAQRTGWGHETRQPIFIVGLPRSGTTLTEQLIGSHPACFGAGELYTLTDVATAIPNRLGIAGPPWPECAPLLGERHAYDLAGDYLAEVNRRAPSKMAGIVDKQPLNFWHLGLVAICFPNARIVHCTRDLRDNGFSIYCQNFNRQQDWATDLEDIVHYWSGYRRLMRHWQKTSRLSIMEVAYEDTVDDLEGQARRLLDFLELPWDSDVLSFHKYERAVQTPSRWQVRQPIYKTAKAKWRRYVRHLAPLTGAGSA